MSTPGAGGDSFQRMPTWPPVTGCRARAEIFDFNGDGKSDLVGFDNLNYNANTNPPTAFVSITPLRSTGTTFVAAAGSGSISIPCGFCTQYVKPSEPQWIRADINGDGKSDLVGIYGRQTLDDPVAGTWGDPQGLYILPLLSTGNGFVPQAVAGGGGGTTPPSGVGSREISTATAARTWPLPSPPTMSARPRRPRRKSSFFSRPVSASPCRRSICRVGG